jgi:ankyrin repeat protein
MERVYTWLDDFSQHCSPASLFEVCCSSRQGDQASSGRGYFAEAAFHGDSSVFNGSGMFGSANINEVDAENNTPLHWACVRGHIQMVNTLISHGANPNAANDFGDTPMHWASSGGHLEAIQALFLAGARIDVSNRDGTTPLHFAAADGHVAILQFLIGRHAHINVVTKDGDSALHWACAGAHVNAAQVLLDAGTDHCISNKDGNTAMHVASAQGSAVLVELLLRNRVNPNVFNRETKRRFIGRVRTGMFPWSNLYCLPARLPRFVNRRSEYPIHFAAKHASLLLCRELLIKGADPNSATLTKEVPLHMAAVTGACEIIRLLIDSGADVSLRDQFGLQSDSFCFIQRPLCCCNLTRRGWCRRERSK